MKIKKSILVFGVVTLSLVTACTKNSGNSSSLYVPTTTDVTATATLQELQQGRSLYMSKCDACHGLYSPDNYSSAQWKQIISSMGPKTNMTSAETQLVTKYVTRGNQ
jgi:hypothetical protein